MKSVISDLELAFILADIADNVTLKFWSPHGVAYKTKADGTHVTTADGDAEIAIRQALRTARPDDGFIGEEIGSRPSRICIYFKSSTTDTFHPLNSPFVPLHNSGLNHSN